MYKNKKLTMFIYSMFFSQGVLWAQVPIFEPSISPLSIVSQPKPNIFLLIDDSGSMWANDVMVGEHFYGHGDPICQWNLSSGKWNSIKNSEQYNSGNYYDPFSAGRYVAYNPAVHKLPDGSDYDGSIKIDQCAKEARMKSVNQVNYKILQSYQYRAYLGWGTMGGNPPAYYGVGSKLTPIIFSPLMDFSKYTEAQWATEKQQVMSITASGQNPTYYSLYEINKYFRGFPTFTKKTANKVYEVKQHALPERYRCTTNAIITLTDGGDGYDYADLFANVDKFTAINTNNTVASPHPNLIVTSDRYQIDRWQAPLAARDDIERILAQEITPEVGLNIPSVDKAGKPWKGDKFAKPQKIIYAGLTFGYQTFNSNLRSFFERTGGRTVLQASDNSAEKMIASIDSIIRDIVTERSNGQLINDTRGFKEGSVQYRSAFDLESRFGEVVGYQMNGADEWERIWNTKETITPSAGYFKTMNYGMRATKPKVATLTVDALKENYSSGLDIVGGDVSLLSNRYIQWLKGEIVSNDTVTYEDEKVSLRTTPLGPIVNAEIAHAKKNIEYINVNSVSAELRTQFASYIAYKNKQQPNNLLVVNTNDGLVNFLASGSKTSNRVGQRIAAYFPGFLGHRITDIAGLNKDFSYNMDGKAILYEFKGKDGVFKTIGVSGMGVGGKGLVGYQLFSAKYNPSSRDFSNANIEITPLFEINNDGPNKHRTPDFENLGYTYSDISFFNQRYTDSNGAEQSRGVAVFGNGPGNKASSLYLIDVETGTLLSEVVLNIKGGGALSPALVVEKDPSGFQKLQRIYIGDLSGDLYRLEFTDSLTPVKTKIFEAKLADGSNPITVRPLVWKDTNDYWVYFGTGSILSKNDRGDRSKKLQYAIGFQDNQNTVKHLDELLKYDLSYGDSIDGVKLLSISVADDNSGSSKSGWYIPLQIKGETKLTGERIVATPTITTGNDVIFTTWGLNEFSNDLTAYKNDPCVADIPFSKLIALNLKTGAEGSFKFKKEKATGIAVPDQIIGVPTGPHVSQDSGESGEKRDDGVTNINIEEPEMPPPLVTEDPECVNGEANIMLGGSQSGVFNGTTACSNGNLNLEPKRISVRTIM